MKKRPFYSASANRQHMEQPHESFQEFEASELYCPTCGRAVPVNKFLLLVLADGDRYEYRCQLCGTKVGDKIDHSGQFYGILRK
ncbi:MAG TPA: hypothetical protein DDW42_05835 [Desulfobacteraceae bacterium]|nr:hypothetical protein [Desulfobacteraceae bacterium]